MVVRPSIHRAALPALLYLLTCETAVLAGATADTLQLVPADRGNLSFSDSNGVSVAALAADAAADSVGGSPVVAADGTKAINSNRSSSNNDSSLPPLIPLQVLLSPARFRLPQLSPDGNFLAFLQPSKETGINSVFVTALPPSSGSSTSSTSTRTRTSTSTSSTSVGSSSSSIPSPSSSSSDSGIDSFSLLAQGLISPQRVTDTPTPVGDFFWSKDSKGILFVVDSGAGSEDYHLYWVPLTFSSDGGSSGSKQQGDAQSVNITPGAAVNLTPFKGVKTQGLWLSQTDPSHVFVGLNRREKSVFDIHSIDLKSQDMTLDTVNPGNVTAWVVTPDFTIGAAVMAGAGDGSRHLVYRDPNTPDGCPAAPTAAAAATSSSKQPVYLQNAVANSSAQQQQQQQQQRRYAQGHSKNTKVLTSGSSGGSIGRSTGRRLLQVVAGNGSMGVSEVDSSSTTGSGGIGRLLLQIPADISAAAGYLADSSSAVSSSSGSGSSKGSSQSVNDAIAESSSKSRVACWRRVYKWPFGEDGRVWGFNQDADGIFITSSVERDTTELQLISTNSDKPGTIKQRIASHPLVDVNDVFFDNNDRQPAALSLDYHKPVWSFAHEEDQQEWDRLEAWRPGEVASPVSSSQDKRVWIVEYSRGNGNTAFYLHRRGTFPPQLLFNQQPTLSNYTLATTHSVVVKARDGLDIPGYLTLPVLPNIPAQLPKAVAGQVPDPHTFAVMQRSSKPPSQPQQQQQREGAGVSKVDWSLPMVLMVHGGPWRRTSWGTSASLTQWLANRGYAVLNVNFRGSTGYGKKFTHQGDNQWGVGSMQHDLSDAVAWAVNSGIADPKRVCIMGSSYGGYATFAGLAFTPQLYRCGISFSGIANLANFARAMPPYWGPIRNRWLLRVGNVTADEALNRRLSPVFHAQNIRAPVLIGQGGNDVRVTQVEAAAMFNALKRQRHKEVQFVLYPDEGHSITRLANRLDFYSRAEQLLGDVLGGRRQDFVKHKLTSAQVKA